jgi:hypothetical protein
MSFIDKSYQILKEDRPPSLPENWSWSSTFPSTDTWTVLTPKPKTVEGNNHQIQQNTERKGSWWIILPRRKGCINSNQWCWSFQKTQKWHQHLCLIKSLSKQGRKGNFLEPDKEHLPKPYSYRHEWWWVTSISLTSIKRRRFVAIAYIQYCIGVLASAKEQVKTMRGIQVGKEEAILSYFCSTHQLVFLGVT